MYGFGDDRNPSHDSVNVLEEILVEYIVDVVCDPHFISLISIRTHRTHSVKQLSLLERRRDCPLKTFGERCRDLPMRRSWLEWKSCFSCRKILSELVPSSKSPILMHLAHE